MFVSQVKANFLPLLECFAFIRGRPYNTPVMRSRLQLLFWGLVLLIALDGLGRNSPAYRRVYDTTLVSDWMYVLAHILLYAGLVLLFLGAFRFPSTRKALPAVFRMVLMVGVMQEVTQSLSRGTIPLRGILFDLGVDLVGGLLGLVVGTWYFHWRNRRSISRADKS